MQGFGKITFSDKSYYEGYFEKGTFAKSGKFVDQANHIYELDLTKPNTQDLKKLA